MLILRKYTFLISLFILSLPLLYSFLALRYLKEETERDIERDIMLVTDIVKKTLETMMLEGKGRDFHLNTLLTGNIHLIRLVKPDGNIIDSSNLSEVGGKLSSDELNFLLKDMPGKFSYKKDGVLFYSIISPIYNEKPCQSCHGDADGIKAILTVEMSGRYYSGRLFNIKVYLIVIFLLSIILVYLIYRITRERLIKRPLIRISNRLNEIASRIQKEGIKIKSTPDDPESILESMDMIINEIDKKREGLQKREVSDMSINENITTLDELVSTIAHEIKNPLAGISGAIQVLMEEFDEKDPRREIVKEIVSEIERLDRSVKTLIQFARPEEPVMVKTRVESIIQKLLCSIEDEAKRCGVKIITDFNPEMEIILDPEQMNQVFINISINALQSMPSGGEFIITVRPEDDYAVFTFRDTGYGISPEDIRKIFKPFFTTRHTCSGLGLAISKVIVEKHGGKIRVDSIQGLGTTFSIILPWKRD